jgi:hypothetical protein
MREKGKISSPPSENFQKYGEDSEAATTDYRDTDMRFVTFGIFSLAKTPM